MALWKWIAICILALGLILIETILIHDSAHLVHWWNMIPGFYSIFGFAGCLIIIFVSKFLGKLFLQQREDYYDVD